MKMIHVISKRTHYYGNTVQCLGIETYVELIALHIRRRLVRTQMHVLLVKVCNIEHQQRVYCDY